MYKQQDMQSSSFILLDTLPDDGQKWPKHVEAKLLLILIKLVTLDGLVLLIHVTICPSGLRYLVVSQQFPSEN
jgi:hypothetical protein